MKKLRLFLLASLTLLLLAASAPIVTDSLVRIQTDPGASTTVTAFFQKTTVIDSDTFQGAIVAIANQERTDPTPPAH